MENPPLQPGIYFDLPSEIYHKDRALSRSNLVHLLDTPSSYWLNSWMNPDRKEIKASDPMKYGSAFDCLLFEPHNFKKRYQVVPIDVWNANKIKIELAEYNAIIDSIKVLRASKDAALFLTGGKPKVTIVFNWMGYTFRCEFDYFLIHGTTDYKAVHSLSDYHLQRSFKEYGLDIQLALYKKARAEFKRQFKEGTAHVFGVVDQDFFLKFLKSEMNEFMFIAQRNSKPYPFRPLFPQDDTEDSGLMRINDALKIYEANLAEHGPNKPWPVCTGKPEIFSMFYGSRD